MKPIKVVLVTLLSGSVSIGSALLGQRFLADNPVVAGRGSRIEVGIRTLPDFRLFDLDGRPVTSTAWAGKILVLNYWATWCSACVRELPLFIRAQETWRTSGVQFVGIAVDRAVDVKDFVAGYPVNFPLLIADPESVALSQRLGNRVAGLPFTVIFDRRGRRVFSWIGEVTNDALEAQLATLSK